MYKEFFEKYIQGVNSSDPDLIADLFAENGVFDDKGARGIYKPEDLPPVLNGREEIRKAFQGWDALKIKATVIDIIGNVMFYDVVSGGIFIPAVGMVEMKDGKVETYTIRARKDEI